jgi:hypothetical protein
MPAVDEAIGEFFVRMHDAPSDTRSKKAFQLKRFVGGPAAVGPDRIIKNAPMNRQSVSAGSFEGRPRRHTARRQARVVICGTGSIASWDPIPSGPRVERHLLVKRARMQGLLIFDYADRFREGRERLASWVAHGQLKYLEDILPGIEHAPDAIAGLYRGENQGKRLIQVSADPTLSVA